MSSLHTVESVLEYLLESIHADDSPPISDDVILGLHGILGSNTVVAALDLVDKDAVKRLVTPWGREFFQVDGSTDTYAVTLLSSTPPLSLPSSTSNSLLTDKTGVIAIYTTPSRQSFCSCPAFTYSTLLYPPRNVSETRMATDMCKHLLAVRLAQRLNKYVERGLSEEDVEVALAKLAGISIA